MASCGAKAMKVSGDAGDAATFDAAPEVAGADVARVDAAREARAEVAVDALPLLPDAALALCGPASGAVCPVHYVSTSVIMGRSSTGFTAAMASDDTLYLGGGFESSTDFDPSAGMDVRVSEAYGAFVTKLGPTGAYGFTATFAPSLQWAGVWSLSATTNTVAALGAFHGSIDLDPGPGVDTHSASPAVYQQFAVKLTSTGAFVWGHTLGVSQDGFSEEGSASWSQVASAADGTTTLSGGYRGVVDLDLGPGTHAPPDPQGAFVTRLDDKGDLMWVRTLGGAACEVLDVSVALGADGTAWFAGTFQGTCVFDQSGVGSGTASAENGMFVASLTPDGALSGLWTVAANAHLVGLSVAPNGAVYVGGGVGPTLPGQAVVVDFDPSAARAERTLPADTSSTFVLSLEANGTFRWVKLLADLQVSAIAADTTGGVLVAGTSADGPVGMFVLSLDAQQREAWRFFAGGRSTVPSALTVGAKDFAVAGTQTSPGDLDPSSNVDRFEGTLSFVSRYRF